MKKVLGIIAGIILVCWTVYGQKPLDLFPDRPGSLICWTEIRSVPRQLRIHYLKTALNIKELEVIVLTGEDPDGTGPAESQLTQPEDLFKKFGTLAAVNANAFAGSGDNKTPFPKWSEGLAVDVYGIVVSGGKTISPIENKRMSFWLDTGQKPHIGDPPPGSSVAEAVSDWFSPLIMDMRIIPDESDTALHPRTALGFDDSGTWLLLVVIDGRQPGYSEGVTLYELATILRSKGCSQSINLDGGGSSIMLIQEPGKEIRTFNRPSDKSHRPVPVMLGIRKSTGSR